MAGDSLRDPAKALEYKELGNGSFKKGDYIGAECYYTKACVLFSGKPAVPPCHAPLFKFMY